MESSPVPISWKTKIFYRGCLEVTKNNEPYFWLVSIDVIKGVCFAVPNIEDPNEYDFLIGLLLNHETYGEIYFYLSKRVNTMYTFKSYLFFLFFMLVF